MCCRITWHLYGILPGGEREERERVFEEKRGRRSEKERGSREGEVRERGGDSRDDNKKEREGERGAGRGGEKGKEKEKEEVGRGGQR